MTKSLSPARRMPARLAIVVAVIALSSFGCGDDDAGDDGSDEPIGAGPFPVADLMIEYQHPDEGVEFSYRITCLGDTATLTGDPVEVGDQAACLALADSEVQRRLIDGADDDVACTEQYGGPDVATIAGTIDDQAVDTSVDRANGCGISDWDDLLVDVLPPPIGVTG